MNVTRHYAEALYRIYDGDVEKLLEIWEELQEVSELFSEIDNEYMGYLLQNPSEYQVIESFFEKYSTIIQNFIHVLVEDGFIGKITEVKTDYRQILVNNNILNNVLIESATILSEDTKTKLLEIIQERFGMINDVRYRINESLIKGIRLEVNETVIDSTVRSRLDQMVREV